jgi:hypothetical protein
MVCQILKILGTHGVTPAQINMNLDFWSSYCKYLLLTITNVSAI